MEETMDTNTPEDNNISAKAGKLTKKIVRLSKSGANKAKQVPGKTATASKRSVESFKTGFKNS
jgi:hypothetical protein